MREEWVLVLRVDLVELAGLRALALAALDEPDFDDVCFPAEFVEEAASLDWAAASETIKPADRTAAIARVPKRAVKGG